MHVLTAVEFVIASLFDLQNSHKDNHGKQTRALKCKPSAQIMRDDRKVYCNYQVDVYISGIVKQLLISLSIN